MNYSDYKVEDWVIDDEFIDYVNGADSEKFERLKDEPEHADNIEEASRIVRNIERTHPLVNDAKLEFLYEKVNNTIDESARPGPRIVNMKWVGIAAAAVAAVIIFLPLFMASESNHLTTIAQQSDFKLPDSSLVQLNSVSSIKYNSKSWKKHRYLLLEGEAFFDVKEGSKFIVKSNQGIVSVIGTKFNIRDREGFYEVECTQGSVRVALQSGGSFDLEKGDRLSKIDGKEPILQKGVVRKIDWLNDYIEIEDQKMKHVLDEVSRHFNIKFSNIDSIADERYTGFFTTESLDSAVHQILWPMGVEYEMKDKKVIIKSFD